MKKHERKDNWDKNVSESTAFFDLLWNVEVIPKLPSKAWAIHHCSNAVTRLICISEVMILQNLAVERKKVVITPNYVHYYISDVGPLNIEHNVLKVQFKTIDDLEMSLFRFDNLLCYSGGGNMSTEP